MKLQEIGEFGLIDLIKQGTINDPGSIVAGIGDDAAVIRPHPQHLQLLTTDMLVEDIHFSLKTTTPWQLGYKAMAVNFSDIAAMGGRPRHAVVAVAIPPVLTVEFIINMYDGMKAICKEYGVNIAGGDTVASRQGLVINVTVVGEAVSGNVVLRSGAQPGDIVAVTGPLGSSGGGLALLQRGEWEKFSFAPPLVAAHLTPRPQVELGTLLAAHGVSSMDDISDGLASEVHEIAAASKVGMVIDAAKIPLAPELIAASKFLGKPPLDYALYGGEDYQLLVTLSPETFDRLIKEFGANILTPIGRVVPSAEGVLLVADDGQASPLAPHGYNHFINADRGDIL